MKRKGFTLVELLIVIAIIGALSATMTLSTGSSAAKAKAAAIVSGFKIVRTAVVMYELDSADQGVDKDIFNARSKDYVGPESAKLLQEYSIDSKDQKWTAAYTYGDAKATALKTQINDIGSKIGITASPDGKAYMDVLTLK